MPHYNIPIPPLEMRRMVGPTDPEAFDNTRGQPIYSDFGLSLDVYESVFDFGCGCGRVARQLLQQNPRPSRYVGIDVHRGMIDWCKKNLSPIDPNFQFFHHDVYSPSYAPKNSLRLAEPFPVNDGKISLIIAHSVFTHLFRRQTEYYLREVARILMPKGVAFTSWFFFDKVSFPFFSEGPFCLFAGETDPTQAVIYDRRWFRDTIRRIGLNVMSTKHPMVPGHQWTVFLRKKTEDSSDQFHLGEDGAEWLCGATCKVIAVTSMSPKLIEKGKVASLDSQVKSEWPQPPALFGALAELERMSRLLAELERIQRVFTKLKEIKRSWSWKIGRSFARPLRVLKRFLFK